MIASLIGFMIDFLMTLPNPANTALTLSKAADISLLEPIISIILSFNKPKIAINEAIRPIMKPIGLAFIAAFNDNCAGTTAFVAVASTPFAAASAFVAVAFAFIAVVFACVAFVTKPIDCERPFVLLMNPSIP